MLPFANLNKKSPAILAARAAAAATAAASALPLQGGVGGGGAPSIGAPLHMYQNKQVETYDPLGPCAECKGETVLDMQNGTIVCTRCGLVADNQYISDEQEWRTFADGTGADMNRVARAEDESYLLSNGGLATMMGDSPYGLGSSSLQRLQNKLGQSTHVDKIKATLQACDKMTCIMPGGHQLVRQVKDLIKRAIETSLLRSKPAAVLAATCIFIVCKQEGVPITITEASGYASGTASGATEHAIKMCYKQMKREVGIKGGLRPIEGGLRPIEGGLRPPRTPPASPAKKAQPRTPHTSPSKAAGSKSTSSPASSSGGVDGGASPPSPPNSWVVRWNAMLCLSPALMRLADQIIVRMGSLIAPSFAPTSVAAAAMRLASQCGEPADVRTCAQVHLASGVSQSTIQHVVSWMLIPKHRTVLIIEGACGPSNSPRHLH